MGTVLGVLFFLAVIALAAGWWCGVFSFERGEMSQPPERFIAKSTEHATAPPPKRPFDANAPTLLFPEEALRFAVNEEAKLVAVSSAARLSIATMSCGCDDFRTRRAHLVLRDVRRLCCHLQQRLIDIGVPRILPEHLAALIRSQYLERHAQIHVQDVFGHPVVFTLNLDSPWVNVIVRKRRRRDTTESFTGEYGCYGFNMNESRWSWGEGPDGARELRRRIALSFERLIVRGKDDE